MNNNDTIKMAERIGLFSKYLTLANNLNAMINKYCYRINCKQKKLNIKHK